MNVFHSQKKRKGFSLVELIVVILIIAILAVAVFAGGSAAIKKSQVSRTTSDLHNFSIAIESAMNETPSVANINKVSEMEGTILKTISANLPAEYELSAASTIASGNLQLTQSADGNASYKIFESKKTDAWGNPYYVVLDATERHNDGISEFYVTVISAGPNAQTKICQALASVTDAEAHKGIEADDLFLLVQYTDGDVSAVIYNCANDTLKNGGTAATADPVAPANDDQLTLAKTVKGVAKTGDNHTTNSQGFYIGTILNADARGTLCPVNFQPAA